jgi:radical SAM superfamily enzyme YgiQ (UPF0313 family)
MPEIVLAAINAKWIHPSLALRLIKANLGSLAGNCGILEFALRQPLKEKAGPILAARPRILGISVSVWNHRATLELLEALEEKWEAGQKPAVVLGGPEVSWLPEEAEIFRYADYVIRGEGEESFRSLCGGILGGGRRAETRERAAVFINNGGAAADLNKINSAYNLYTDEDIKKKLVYVEASRGCPFGCEFCQGPVRRCNGEGGTVREFPLGPFLADMETLAEKGAGTIKFLDRSFNLNIGRAVRIMGFFLERIEAGKPLRVHFEMVPSRFPPELRELVRRFPPGTLRLELGIQTFNPETAALIRRASEPEAELEALRFLRRETSALVHADLIAGLPGESLASFGAGFDRLWRALSGSGRAAPFDSPFEIQPGILKCLPGTPLARRAETYGMKYSPEPPYEVTETGALSADELGRVKNFARFWELVVNRGPFPDLLPRLLPPGEGAFDRFMILSDRTLARFGRNWGLDRKELGAFLAEYASSKPC